MAFVSNLVFHEREMETCLPLRADEAYAERNRTLEAMLA